MFMRLVRAIVAGESGAALRLLAETPALARVSAGEGATRAAAKPYFFEEIRHYLYAGDTALHMAAAAYARKVVKKLIALGADVEAANRRGARPLHYAVDGGPGPPGWDPEAQAAGVVALIAAGADPNATDAGGVTPLHRAVRNGCAAAVEALLDGGADPRARNKSGSTPLQLTAHTTGRSGSGSPEAKQQQEEIVRLLRARGAGTGRA